MMFKGMNAQSLNGVRLLRFNIKGISRTKPKFKPAEFLNSFLSIFRCKQKKSTKREWWWCSYVSKLAIFFVSRTEFIITTCICPNCEGCWHLSLRLKLEFLDASLRCWHFKKYRMKEHRKFDTLILKKFKKFSPLKQAWPNLTYHNLTSQMSSTEC